MRLVNSRLGELQLGGKGGDIPVKLANGIKGTRILGLQTPFSLDSLYNLEP